MYDMYPEWGPAKHRTEDREEGSRPVRTGRRGRTDQRDEHGERPDDN